MLIRSFISALLVLIVLALPNGASAATVTLDFESGPPIGTAVNDDYKASAFTFFRRSDPGFRPYRRTAGVPTHSGTVAGDVSPNHCFPDESDDASLCEFPGAGTQGNLTKSASSVSLFAGLFTDPGTPATVNLTAFRADGSEAAKVSKDVGVGITTLLTVTSTKPDIVTWSLDADSFDLGIDDVSYTLPDTSVPEISLRAPIDTVPVLQGSHTDVPISVTRINGSDGPVRFTASGLPKGVSARVIPDPLPGTQSAATLRLTAAGDATTTFFQNATLTANPQGNAGVAPAPRSAPLSVRVASSYDLAALDTTALHLPQCAPVDRDFELDRDRSFAGTATLTLEDVPQGVSAEIVEGSTIAPGGGFNAHRTLRVSRGADFVPDGSAITIRAHTPGFPDKTIALPIDNAPAQATVASPAAARTARLLQPGTTIRLDGNGFCSGSTVAVGNFTAVADANVAADHKSLTFVTPRSATTGRVVVKPAGGGNGFQTSNDLTVASFRGEDGLAFANFHFGALSIDEFTEAFGADDLFLQVNPCWPFGDCTIPTGILDPLAAIEWPLYNAILRGGDGHCYGMNRAIQELLARKTTLRRWSATARVPFELPNATGPQNGLVDYLDSRQALQLSSEALINRFDRDENLGDQVDRIHSELAQGRFPGVVMQHGALAGHEVTAFDMEKQGDGSTTIFAYDSNRPLTGDELGSPVSHLDQETQAATITISPDGNRWSFTTPSGAMWSGGGDDGSLYAVTLSDIPDNPSLPGLTDTPLIVTDIIASVDGAAQAGPPPAGGTTTALSDQTTGTPGTAQQITAPKGSGSLTATVNGVHDGRYSQMVVDTGFVAGVKDVATAKGVHDKLTGSSSDGALTFAGQRDRALSVDLAVDRGDVHRAASVTTGASAGGADTVALGKGAALTYTHRGATTRASFTLTNAQSDGGPVTFSSGPMTVHRGERVTLTPQSWRSLGRVRARFSGGGSKVLRNRAAFGARFSLGTPKLAKGRASVATAIRRVPAKSAGGVVLRLMRGHRTVARKSVAITAPHPGRHSYNWRLPSETRHGSYRLVVDMALAGGVRAPGRRTARTVARVRV